MGKAYNNQPHKSNQSQGSVSTEFRIPLDVLGNAALFSKHHRIYLLHFLYGSYVSFMPSTAVAALFTDISPQEVKNARAKLMEMGLLESYKVPVPGGNPHTHYRAVLQSAEDVRLNVDAFNRNGKTSWGLRVVGGESVEESAPEELPAVPEPVAPPAPVSVPNTPDKMVAIVTRAKASAWKIACQFSAGKSDPVGRGGATRAAEGFVAALFSSFAELRSDLPADALLDALTEDGASYEALVVDGMQEITNRLGATAGGGLWTMSVRAGLGVDDKFLRQCILPEDAPAPAAPTGPRHPYHPASGYGQDEWDNSTPAIRDKYRESLSEFYALTSDEQAAVEAAANKAHDNSKARGGRDPLHYYMNVERQYVVRKLKAAGDTRFPL